MKKKLVTALVLASLFSGVSAVYADYTDQEIDTKVNEINDKYNALDGKVNNLTQGVEANTRKIEGIEQKQQVAEGKFTSFEQENRTIKEKIGNISNGLEAEKNARGELEKTLSTNIEGVRNALGIAITNSETKEKELDEKIATEATARETKDKELEEKITDEKTAREAKEAELSGKITDEKDDRVAKDIELGNDLKAEKTAREEKDKELDGKISSETAAREALEKKFNGRFDQETEVLDRETKERKEEDAKIRSEFAAGDQVLGQRIDKLATDTDKGLAKVSALAGLHPLDYDPANKLNLAAAGGFYNGENAVALGAFYRPNRNVMLSFGASLAGGDNAYNVGVSVKVGKGGDRMDESSTTVSELYALVGRMQEEMMAQRNQIAEQQRKIEELEAR